MGYGVHDREIALVEDAFDGRMAVFYDGQPLVTLPMPAEGPDAFAAALAAPVPPASPAEEAVVSVLAEWLRVASADSDEDWAPRSVALYRERPGHGYPLALEERYEAGMDSSEDDDAWFDEAFEETLRIPVDTEG